MVLKPPADASLVFDGASSAHPHVVWHDLECGTYRADLPLWRELADAHPNGAILDIGAGSGRVALDLARRGRRVVALDRDPVLLAALRERAGELDIETVRADARSFALPHEEPVALCIVPMQTVQLLGGCAGRTALLRQAHAHLLPGGLLACALVTELDPFDCTDGGHGPSPETCHRNGVRYTSQATRVQAQRHTIVIERHRRTSNSSAIERDLIELDRIGAAELEREGIAAGLRPAPARRVPTTADHAGSDVVMLHV
ncbi:MAG TPA: class I SAM-dependent methyltransferase [Solirubrobacteraceae bacterium]|jgi:SAM-dependent methyltransferase|nr:class I SAM-dependent methyltransferase [Solirubrobacteraceae bacterium]